MSSKTYWEKREAEALKHYLQEEQEYQAQLRAIYQNMLDAAQKEIDAFYGRYADKEQITLAEAKRRVSKLDIAAYQRKAKRYVADKDFSKQANEEMRLYNLTMKVNRLEMLKANIGLELVAGHDEQEKFMAKILRGRTEEELQRQAGILGKTVRNNAKLAETIPNASFHGATFSERIWGNQTALKAELSKQLQVGMIQGKNPRVLAREIQKTFGTSTSNAERLMRTELARVQTEAQRQSFLANGFEMYTFHVNHGCCAACSDLDGKHFKIKDMMPGKNAPPMHPNCRCSVSAYEDDAEYEAWLDFLDKGGTTEEWEALKDMASGRKLVIQTGGRYEIGSPKWWAWTEKRDKQADAFYEKVREDDSDISRIAVVSGMTQKEITEIKNHVFWDKHILYDGDIGRVDSDYNMAVAWKRLLEGVPEARDLLLLRHELLESRVERMYNLPLDQAHAKANEKYNWQELMKEMFGEDGEADDLL